MNYYNRKKPDDRCPYCKANVQKPYKGIHKEAELISGIPVQCRNNGKLNTHIARGYLFEKEPKENIFYFIEDPETRKWYNGFGGWTNDPNEAFKMEFEWVADRFARMEKIEKYTITEHEFFNYYADGILTTPTGK